MYDFGVYTNLSDRGRSYSKEFLNRYGTAMTYAHIKDLGFSDKDTKDYTKQIVSSGTAILNESALYENYYR